MSPLPLVKKIFPSFSGRVPESHSNRGASGSQETPSRLRHPRLPAQVPRVQISGTYAYAHTRKRRRGRRTARRPLQIQSPFSFSPSLPSLSRFCSKFRIQFCWLSAVVNGPFSTIDKSLLSVYRESVKVGQAARKVTQRNSDRGGNRIEGETRKKVGRKGDIGVEHKWFRVLLPLFLFRLNSSRPLLLTSLSLYSLYPRFMLCFPSEEWKEAASHHVCASISTQRAAACPCPRLFHSIRRLSTHAHLARDITRDDERPSPRARVVRCNMLKFCKM